MLGNRHYYHGLTRNYIAAFGNLFNELDIKRFDNNKKTIEEFRVPISYGPTEKYVSRLENHENLDDRQIAVEYPRMVYEMERISYTAAHDVSSVKRLLHKEMDSSTGKRKMASAFVEVPYTLHFRLSVVGRTTNDIYQVIEQIIPFFRKQVTLKILIVPELAHYKDIVTTFSGSPTMQDNYDDSFERKRSIVATLDFDMNAYYIGDVNQSSIIKKAQVDFSLPKGEGPITAAEIENTPRSERYTVRPGLTKDGFPTDNIKESIPLQQIQVTDNYGYIEGLSEYFDNYKYDPVSGRDKEIT